MFMEYLPMDPDCPELNQRQQIWLEEFEQLQEIRQPSQVPSHPWPHPDREGCSVCLSEDAVRSQRLQDLLRHI
jgi:hypothetical protein